MVVEPAGAIHFRFQVFDLRLGGDFFGTAIRVHGDSASGGVVFVGHRISRAPLRGDVARAVVSGVRCVAERAGDRDLPPEPVIRVRRAVARRVPGVGDLPQIIVGGHGRVGAPVGGGDLPPEAVVCVGVRHSRG